MLLKNNNKEWINTAAKLTEECANSFRDITLLFSSLIVNIFEQNTAKPH